MCRIKAADEMKFAINLVFCALVLLTSSSQTQGQSNVFSPVFTLSHTATSATPDLTEDPGNEVPQRTHNPTSRAETSIETITKTKGTVHSEAVTNAAFKTHLLNTNSAVAASQHMSVSVTMTVHTSTASVSAAADSLSSTPTVPSTTPLQHASPLLTRDPLATFSSRSAHTAQDTSSTAHASVTQPQSGSLTTAATLTSAPGWAPAGPTHHEVPSELNVGDEDFKGPRYRSSSPLDPLLAGLLSVFIATTAVVFVILFLKFRQRTNHPEFHRLQDLPMDDLMEDTPLSRYTY
ncbi:mucin-13-like [Mastacembelus armatus]|uniref:Si:ch73-344o19.1 n=1 Tax=Mastacembelus armatus TaxID=205130 RepID=A0A3Q3MVI2_9TELE|nr:mucin-13-like [Mastacembelus armatus]